MKRNFLLFMVLGTLFSMNVFAAVSRPTPVAGEQFRIQSVTNKKLYLTADPAWSPAEDWQPDSLKWKTGGWNVVFFDSLYTVPVEQEYTLPYINREPETITVSTDPDNQIFTLRNPDPNDPDHWAIETADGQYISIDRRNSWDVTLSPDADNTGSQFFFLHQVSGIYLFRFASETATHYFASDGSTAGIKVDQYADGYDHAYRTSLFRDKPSTQETAMFYFEKVGGSNAIADVKAAKSLTVSVNNDLLTVNVENGTAITLYNVTGAKVLETKYQGSININRLPAGVYIIETSSGEKTKFTINI